MNYNLHFQETFYPKINTDSIDLEKRLAVAGECLEENIKPNYETWQMEMWRSDIGLVLYRWYRDPVFGLCAEILPLANHPELYVLWDASTETFIAAEAEAFLQAMAADDVFDMTRPGFLEANNLRQISLTDEMPELVWAEEISRDLYRILETPINSQAYHLGDVIIAIDYYNTDEMWAVQLYERSQFQTLSICAAHDEITLEQWHEDPVHEFLREIGWESRPMSDPLGLVISITLDQEWRFIDLRRRFPALHIHLY